jgi:hypothetical protein
MVLITVTGDHDRPEWLITINGIRNKVAFLQPLGIEGHADTVVPKDFNQITASTSEDVKIAGMGITAQRLLDL